MCFCLRSSSVLRTERMPTRAPGVVDLLPATAGDGFVNKTLSSWGGKVGHMQDSIISFADSLCYLFPDMNSYSCPSIPHQPLKRHCTCALPHTLELTYICLLTQVLKLGDTYHMFASAMANNCTLAQFSTNSMSIHAIASSPRYR